MNRWSWLALLVALLVLGIGYVLMQLTILQPPVVEPNFFEKRKAKFFIETMPVVQMQKRNHVAVGMSELYDNTSKANNLKPVVLLLPDSGTGAWFFEKWMTALDNDAKLYAMSWRGQWGAKSTSSATLGDYLQDAKMAFKIVQQQNRNSKISLVGSGLGSLLAMRLANAFPGQVRSVVLVSPFAPRERNPSQNALAKIIGGWIYGQALANKNSAHDFWQKNFSAGFIQNTLAQQATKQYVAPNFKPFEFRPVIDELILGPLASLPNEYQALLAHGFPVLQLAARYDRLNPLIAQQRLRDSLASHTNFSFSMFNSGRYLAQDWKWKESAVLLKEFITDGTLGRAVVEVETPLDPALETPSR